MRYVLKLAYKGTEFHGWQSQPNAVTVQEIIEQALTTLLRKPTSIVGCGRTDTGVHAAEYYAHFDLNVINDLQLLTYQLNSIFPKDIVLYQILKVDDDFHARFDAVSRTYKYYILLGRDPFALETMWQIPHGKYDVDLMNEAAEILLKHTDFQSFSKSKTDVKNYNCEVTEAHWELNRQSLVFTISANRFLRNMVRAVVGTLLDVGSGKLSVQDFENIIIQKNRSEAGLSVPAHGLFLHKISYDNLDHEH